MELLAERQYRRLLRAILHATPDHRVGCQPYHLLEHCRILCAFDSTRHDLLLSLEEKKSGLDLHVRVIEAKELAYQKNVFCTVHINSTAFSPNRSPRSNRKANQTIPVEIPNNAHFSICWLGNNNSGSGPPRWNEDFRIQISDLRREQLQIVIWYCGMQSVPIRKHRSVSSSISDVTNTTSKKVLSPRIRRFPSPTVEIRNFRQRQNKLERNSTTSASCIRVKIDSFRERSLTRSRSSFSQFLTIPNNNSSSSQQQQQQQEQTDYNCKAQPLVEAIYMANLPLKDVKFGQWKDLWLPLVNSKKKFATGNNNNAAAQCMLHIRLRLVPSRTESMISEPESDQMSTDELAESNSEHEIQQQQSECVLDQLAYANNITWLQRQVVQFAVLLQQEAQDKVAIVGKHSDKLEAARDAVETALRHSPPFEYNNKDGQNSAMSSNYCEKICRNFGPEVDLLYKAATQYIDARLAAFARLRSERETKNMVLLLFPPPSLEIQTLYDIKKPFIQSIRNMEYWQNSGIDMHQYVCNRVAEYIENDVQTWLQNIENQIDPISAAITEIKLLCQDLRLRLGVMQNFIQMRLELNYLEMVMTYLDEGLMLACGRLLEKMPEFKHFDELNQWSRKTLSLYMNLKELQRIILDHLIPEGPTQSQINKTYWLLGFQEWFEESLACWLQTWQSNSNKYILKTILDDLDFEKSDPRSNIAEGIFVILAILASEMCEDWSKLEVRNPWTAYIGVVKLTDIFCSSILGYSRYVYRLVAKRIDELNKFKIAIAANSILHLSEFARFELKNILRWEAVIRQLQIDDDQECDNRVNILVRLTERAAEECHQLAVKLVKIIMEKHRPEIERIVSSILSVKEPTMLQSMAQSVKWKFRGSSCPKSIPGDINQLLRYIDKVSVSLGGFMTDKLVDYGMPQLRLMTLNIFRSLIQLGQQPLYYEIILQHLNRLQNLFYQQNPFILRDPDSNRIFETVRDNLKIQADTTENLLLQFYAVLADSNSNYIPPKIAPNGILNIKIGRFRLSGGDICIIIKILDARDLPQLDSMGSCDPFVHVEIMPSPPMPQHLAYTTRFHRCTQNPTFNETFALHLAEEQFLKHGAVLWLTVWDQDKLSFNDLAGEFCLHLSMISIIESENEIDQIPTLILPIQKPINVNLPVYNVIKNRISWDSAAENFVHQRNCLHRGRIASSTAHHVSCTCDLHKRMIDALASFRSSKTNTKTSTITKRSRF